MVVRVETPASRIQSDVVQRCETIAPNAARILEAIADDARITNAALARRVGIPPSTCLNRLQALRSGGLIAGHHTRVDRRQLGLAFEALVGIQLKDKRAASVHARIHELQDLPYVMAVMRTSGAFDLMVQVQVQDADHLVSEVVDPMTEMQDVAGTQTILVVEHWRRMSLAGRFFHV